MLKNIKLNPIIRDEANPLRVFVTGTKKRSQITNNWLREVDMDSINSVSSNNVASKGHNSTKARSVEAEPNKEAMPDVNVDLSEDIKAAESEAMMRQAKVQEMRSAIEEGRFPLDAKKIAENFAELEKLL